MLKNIGKIILLLLLLSSLFLYGALANAGSNKMLGNGSCSVKLDFRIRIRPLLLLQIETLNMLATEGVKSDVRNTFEKSSFVRNSDGARQASMQATIIVPFGQFATLSANYSITQVDEKNSIPFDLTSWTFGGISKSYMSGIRVPQMLYRFINSHDRVNIKLLPHLNERYHQSNIYNGMVTYTLSSP
jgi:hypothetical protein